MTSPAPAAPAVPPDPAGPTGPVTLPSPAGPPAHAGPSAPGAAAPGMPPGRGWGDALGWWGFGLSFGSVLSVVAGAALAVSVLGVLLARRTGRAMVPAVVGCVIAGLATGTHTVLATVHAVERVVSAVQDARGDGSGDPGWTSAEGDYLHALDDSGTETYAVYTDEALVGFGHQACDALDGGESPEQAAGDLDMGATAAAEVVDVASTVLCRADGSGGA